MTAERVRLDPPGAGTQGDPRLPPTGVVASQGTRSGSTASLGSYLAALRGRAVAVIGVGLSECRRPNVNGSNPNLTVSD